MTTTQVSEFLVEPFLNYNLDKDWFLLTDMVMTANWMADSDNRWTVPVGDGIGRVFKVGNQPINSRLEANYPRNGGWTPPRVRAGGVSGKARRGVIAGYYNELSRSQAPSGACTGWRSGLTKQVRPGITAISLRISN